MEGMEREDKHIIYRSFPVGVFRFCESQVTPRTHRKSRVLRLRMRVNRPEALLSRWGQGKGTRVERAEGQETREEE